MTSLKQTLIDAKNTALRPYYSARSWKPFWLWLNCEPRQRFVQAPFPASDVQSSVVESLKRDGIAFTNLESLFPGQDLLSRMRVRADELGRVASPNAKKTFLTQLIELYPQIDLTDLFVTFALSDEVLGCVSGYLEMWPKLYYYTLGVTRPVGPDESPRQSQLWHRDPEDRRMCKVFIYLNDVDETAGPFMYVRGSTREGRWGQLYPQRPPHGRYPPPRSR